MPTRAQLEARVLVVEAQLDAARREVVELREAQTDAERMLAEVQQRARSAVEEVLAGARHFIETELRVATSGAVMATERLHALANATNGQLRTESRDVPVSSDTEQAASLGAAVPVHSTFGAADGLQVARKTACMAELQSALFGGAIQEDATADPIWPREVVESGAPSLPSAARVTPVEHLGDRAGIEDDFWERARVREPGRRRHRHRLLFGALGAGTMVGLCTAGVALAGRM